jgi:uncharacterized membrane protein YraQ (UPF0718 family)
MSTVSAGTLRADRLRAMRFPLALLAATLALALALRAFQDAAVVETFVLVFTSIVIEALPFILLGAIVSGAIAVYVPDRVFERIAGWPLALQIPGASLASLAFPVCECGSVPVARRLVTRGMHPAAAVAFMLAAPVVNPIVLASTYVAYSGRGDGLEMMVGRGGIGLVVAMLVGLAVGRGGSILRNRAPAAPRDHHEHDHRLHEHGLNRRARFLSVVDHVSDDFLFMGKFVVVGAAVAAAFQTIVPQSIISGVAGVPVIAQGALMGLAFCLSLCSEADAFVAASFIGFPLSAQLAFLTFGPVADIKLTMLYLATFRRVTVVRMLSVAIVANLALTLVFGMVTR